MAELPPEGVEDFLKALEEYVPTVPDELTEHYLQRSGFQCPDKRLTRLVSVAAQKFISDIAHDAYQYSRLRQHASKEKSKGPKDKRLVLTTEDLAAALKEYGVNLKKQDYYADTPASGTTTTAKDKAPKNQ